MLLAVALMVIAVSAAAGRSGTATFRQLPPPAATWASTVLAVTAAACSAFVVGVVVATTIGTIPFVAQLGAWSSASLRGTSAVPPALGATLTLALGAAATGLATSTGRHVRSGIRGRRLSRALGGDPGGVVVLPEVQPTAYALAGNGGRIVVSQGLLDALSTEEQLCVLAHERAHLAHHHLGHRAATELAAAVNPLLRPLVAAMRRSTERWADEEAARACGRTITARTIARTAILTAQAPASLGAAAAVDDVTVRIDALLRPPHRIQRAPLLLVGVVVCGLLGGAAATKSLGERDFERAMAAAAPHAPADGPTAPTR